MLDSRCTLFVSSATSCGCECGYRKEFDNNCFDDYSAVCNFHGHLGDLLGSVLAATILEVVGVYARFGDRLLYDATSR